MVTVGTGKNDDSEFHSTPRIRRIRFSLACSPTPQSSERRTRISLLTGWCLYLGSFGDGKAGGSGEADGNAGNEESGCKREAGITRGWAGIAELVCAVV
jgi:hypothetical protein